MEKIIKNNSISPKILEAISSPIKTLKKYSSTPLVSFTI